MRVSLYPLGPNWDKNTVEEGVRVVVGKSQGRERCVTQNATSYTLTPWLIIFFATPAPLNALLPDASSPGLSRTPQLPMLRRTYINRAREYSKHKSCSVQAWVRHGGRETAFGVVGVGGCLAYLKRPGLYTIRASCDGRVGSLVDVEDVEAVGV